MKRFITVFGINYVSMVLLFAFMLFVVPEVFRGDPPLKGVDRVLDWIGYPIGWFLCVYTFPFILIGDQAATFFPRAPWISVLLCLLISSTLWTSVFIYGHRIYHSTMRNTIPILLVAATLLAGCHSPSPVHPQAAAPPPFQPMLITVFGTHPTPDGSWKIGVLEDSIDFARPGSGGMSFTPDSRGWKAQTGWFVFVESESRVWAYDGDRRLYLDTEASGRGAIYYGIFRATNFDSNFPCAVPTQVVSHLPEQKQKEVQTHG